MRSFFTLVFSLIFYNFVIGQSKKLPNIQSPNASAIEKFGEIPVGYYTGVPNISIPIHTVTAGDISIPITIDYHPGSARPDQQPSWVGFGWTMGAEGSITRQQNGSMDEAGGVPLGNFIPYYPNPAAGIPGASGAQLIGGSFDWYAPNKLKDYWKVNSPTTYFYDVQPDEFSFSFLGHSGKFYYDGGLQDWAVASDENIKVTVDGFINGTEMLDALKKYEPKTFDYNLFTNQPLPRSFKGFTLTTEDGIQYKFGGVDAVEYTYPWKKVPFTGAQVNTWFLKEIVDTKGNVVTYHYDTEAPTEYNKVYPTCGLYANEVKETWDWFRNDGLNQTGIKGDDQTYLPDYDLYGSYIFPAYLAAITTDIERVSFSTAIATTLKYTFNQMAATSTPGSNHQLINSDVNNLKVKRLNYIYVNTDEGTIQTFELSHSADLNKRLTLESIALTNPIKTVKYAMYKFTYDGIETLPPYGGSSSDHWGYFNNVNFVASGDYFSQRQTNASYANKGMLKKIQYPTGGYTEFDWEAHRHSQVVKTSRDGLEAYSGYAGGGRIREIRNFNENGTLATAKKYLYVRDYSNGPAESSFTSSGVLNGKPKYQFTIQNRLGFGGNVNVTYRISRLNSIANYGYNGNGSHIGYDEVVEINSDGSYTKYFFTNYGQDKNGVSHFDKPALGKLGWEQNEDAYMPFSSIEQERGKNIGTNYYNSNNILVQKDKTIYRSDELRFLDYVRRPEYYGSFLKPDNTTDGLILAVGYQKFKYKYYPTSKESTTYDTNGSNPLTKTTTYTYNFTEQLASEETTTSVAGETNKTIYLYPTDFPTESTMLSLVSANRISDPVRIDTYDNTQKLSSQITTYLSDATTANRLMPKYLYSAKFPNTFPAVSIMGQNLPMEKIETYEQYDSDGGNISSYKKEDDLPVTIIWGYKGNYPIMIIEGANYSTVNSIINIQNLKSNSDLDKDTGKDAATESTFRGQLLQARQQLLSSDPKLRIKAYTYSYVLGITTMIDEKGKASYYEYGPMCKLKAIKDDEGQLLKEFQYQYRLTN